MVNTLYITVNHIICISTLLVEVEVKDLGFQKTFKSSLFEFKIEFDLHWTLSLTSVKTLNLYLNMLHHLKPYDLQVAGRVLVCNDYFREYSVVKVRRGKGS